MNRLTYSVTEAEPADADEIAGLIRRAIVELCAADHGNDPNRYRPMIANKTADNVRGWIEGPGNVLVAVQETSEGRSIVGVGMGSKAGKVLLNYVLPGATGNGVGASLMRSLELIFFEAGLERSFLTSSIAAENFYRSMGYRETGRTEHHREATFLEFEKALRS